MSEYLAPGVFIEETSFRHKSIEGVGTSVCSLVGPTRSGPLRGTPEAMTSFSQFVRTYGDLSDITFADGKPVPNYTALAARAFFDNGGKQLFVARVVNGVTESDESGDGSSASRASKASGDGTVVFQSRFPGAQGNYTVEVTWRDQGNLFATEQTTTPDVNETLFLTATAVADTAKAAGAILDALTFPIRVSAMVKRVGANLVLLSGEVKGATGAAVAITGEDNKLVTSKLPTDTTTITRVKLKSPISGGLAIGDVVELNLKAPSDISKYTGVAHWGSLTHLRGRLHAAASSSVFSLLALPKDLNDGLANDLDVPLAALAALPAGGTTLRVRRNFDIAVRNGGSNGEVICSRDNLTTVSGKSNSLSKAFPVSPANREDQLTLPITCDVDDTGDVPAALHSLFDDDPIHKPDPLLGTRYLFSLTGGSDGALLKDVDYAGEVDELKGSAGLAALEGVEDVSIVMTPAAAADETSHKAVVTEVQKHCRKMRYRIGLVDSREGMSLGEIRAFRSNFDDSRLALYFPWVRISDPNGKRGEFNVPPAGFIAGICARTDVDRGVHKSPANEVVMGALRFEQEINSFQQELLNPNGVNCLRSFSGRGHRVWGGRTLSSDPEWKYVNVRRYFLYLERSIDKSTQWAVFEPNGEALWGNIRSGVEDFLFNEWKNGRLLGGTPKEAYFVRCDRSTMTQNDIDNGRMVCVVGVAALTPAEFVIFRIGQKTADA